MTWFKDGVVWFASLKALQQLRPQIEKLALAFRTDDEMPPLRSQLTFEAMVDGWRSEPLESEVVHVQKDMIGVQLTSQAAQSLLKMADELERSDKRDQVATRPVRTLTRDTMETRAEGAAEKTVRIAVPDSSSEPTQDEARKTTQVVLRGELLGLLGLGALDRLTFTRPTAPLESGTSLINLLHHIYEKSLTGRCIVRGSTHTKTIWVNRGIPLAAMVQPPIEEEQLGQLLLKANLITPHRLGEAIRFARNNQLSIGATLVQRNLIDEPTLNRTLSRQTYCRIRDIFNWERASYEFGPCELPKDGIHPVPMPVLFTEIAHELLRETNWDFVQLMIQPFLHRYPKFGSPSDMQVKYILQREKVLKVCQQIFDGRRALRQCIRASVLGPRDTTRLVIILHTTGLLKFAADPLGSESNPQQLLQTRIKMLSIEDCFQRLGLSYTAHQTKIREQLLRATDDVAPGTVLHGADSNAAEQVRNLFEEAQQFLATAESRRKYRNQVLGSANIEFLHSVVENQRAFAQLHGETERAGELADVLEELS